MHEIYRKELEWLGNDTHWDGRLEAGQSTFLSQIKSVAERGCEYCDKTSLPIT